MKQLLAALVFLVVLTVALPMSASSKTPPKEQATHDPLFAIVYLPSKVKFEPAPAEVFRCKDLKEPRRKLSLFGKTTRNGTSFYYVFGLVEVDFGAGPTGKFETQNDDGIIVALSPEGCRDIGAGYALSSDPKQRKMAADLGITDEVVTALLSDMIGREVAAFGGASNFLKKVKAAGVPDSYQPPQVRAQLEALRKKAKTEERLKSESYGPLPAAKATNAGTGPAKAMTGKENLNVTWTFAESVKGDVNGVEVPEADISVVVSGKTFNLGTFAGYPTPVTDKKSGMPDYCISACKTWFGGEGEEFCIRRKADRLEVLHRHVDEADAKPESFRKIKEISLR